MEAAISLCAVLKCLKCMVSGASIWRADYFLEESPKGRTAFHEQQGKKSY